MKSIICGVLLPVCPKHTEESQNMACITLLSDFGLHDPSAAIVKGVFMQYTTTPMVDISHEVKPFHIRQAGYLLSVAYKSFPTGTCHVLLFDLFSEATPRVILSEYDGHYFLSPDNGLLSLALDKAPAHSWLCYELQPGETFQHWLHAAGKVLQQLGTQVDLPAYQPRTITQGAPVITPNEIRCEVIHIDQYENVVVNITKDQFQSVVGQRPFSIQFVRVEEINEISTSYTSVRDGYKLARFNSNGYLEICINRGKAASLFGLRLGSKFNDIKITFE